MSLLPESLHSADGGGQDNSERFRERAALTPSAALISTKTFRRVEPNLTQESDESRIGMQWPKVARKADGIGDGDFVDVTPLQLGEEIAVAHVG
jgi:hypothetical protein